jgi:hypothetical protein
MIDIKTMLPGNQRPQIRASGVAPASGDEGIPGATARPHLVPTRDWSVVVDASVPETNLADSRS